MGAAREGIEEVDAGWAQVFIAVISAVIALAALWATRSTLRANEASARAAAESVESARNSADAAIEANRQAKLELQQQAVMYRREQALRLVSYVEEIGMWPSTQPNDEAAKREYAYRVMRAANRLKVIAYMWRYDLVEKEVLIILAREAYITTFERIKAIATPLPVYNLPGNALLDQIVQEVYTVLKNWTAGVDRPLDKPAGG